MTSGRPALRGAAACIRQGKLRSHDHRHGCPVWFRTPRDTGQRLTLSFALSIVAHVVAIALFAGLLQPMLTPVPRRGQAIPIEVALVAVRPIAFTAPPESPATATELPSAPQPTGPAPSVQPMLPPSPSRPEVRVSKHPFGVSVQSDAEAEAVGADVQPHRATRRSAPSQTASASDTHTGDAARAALSTYRSQAAPAA